MQNTRALFAIIAAVSVMAVSLSLSIPLISILLERRGYSSDIIGYMGALPALSFLLITPFVPAMTNFMGAKRLLWASLLLCAASIFLLALSENLILWACLRFAIGTSMAILFLISETWLNQIAREETRGRTVALYTAVLTTGFAVGPIIIQLTGTEGPMPFMIATAIVLAAGLPFFFAGDSFPVLEGKSSVSIFSFMRLAPAICAATLLVAFFDGSVMTLLPVYGIKVGMTEETAVLMTSILLAGNIILQFPIGRLADKYDRHGVMLGCGLVGLAGAIAFPFVIYHPIILWPMLIIWGGAVVGVYTLALTMVGERFKGADLVVANASLGILWGVGSLTGPALAGNAMKIYDPHGMPIVFALSALMFVVVTAFRMRSPAR